MISEMELFRISKSFNLCDLLFYYEGSNDTLLSIYTYDGENVEFDCSEDEDDYFFEGDWSIRELPDRFLTRQVAHWIFEKSYLTIYLY